ncbi:hypothetical protein FF38_11459 [Lucilia cuprina]|uniref:Uncharacterized protein n=1 Tax=Lucilia cuprina TaxID=7375 RepID=A0A0L0CQ91_LUCCU|nr:hypothetical protein FF38_11459 [Lucilia cuprina]
MLECQTNEARMMIARLKYLQQQIKNIHRDIQILLYDTYWYGPSLLEILGTSIRTVENSIYFARELYDMLTSTNIYCLINGPWSQATIDTLLDVRNDVRIILQGTSGLNRLPATSSYSYLLNQFMHSIYGIVSQFVDAVGNRVDAMSPQPTTSSDADPFAEVGSPVSTGN